MIFALLTMLTALSISAVAIYYSVAGLVAIFAAAALPIMIMGGVLEVGKLVTAVWLHRYWQQATWWLKSYLSIAVIVLMFITSMGIFGFLSKAHIEQTSASQESVAQVERLTTEIARQEGIVARAQQRIEDLQSNGVGADANIQSQIDKEQERIDRAFDRIQPAIAQQNEIIADARASDATRTKPYEDQLASLDAELGRLDQQAREYEERISSLSVDNSAVEPLLAQIAQIEDTIVKVQGQIASGEREQVQQAQRTIGANADGSVGPRTRAAVNEWIEQQRQRVSAINVQISELRQTAQDTVAQERDRLGMLVQRIRGEQTDSVKQRQLDILAQIDNVRGTESPAIQTARDEIQRLRESAESQVAQSQELIERLRQQLAQEDKAADIETAIDEQNSRIRNANTEIDTLTEEKYALEAEYRKLEAEVGPVKYLAEFVYGEKADQDLLEEAVRWVILVIIFVFDPLAVLLLIASQYTFELHRKRKDDQKEGHRLDWSEYERLRAQKINDNPGFNIDDSTPPAEEEKVDDRGAEAEGSSVQYSIGADDKRRDTSQELALANEKEEFLEDPVEEWNKMIEAAEKAVEEERHEDVTHNISTPDADLGDMVSEADTTVADAVDTELEQSEVQADEKDAKEIADTRNPFNWEREIEQKKQKTNLSPEQKAREEEYVKKEADATFKSAKEAWKAANPEETLKHYKALYINGYIEKLPWEEKDQTYTQNEEQNENSLFNKLKK